MLGWGEALLPLSRGFFWSIWLLDSLYLPFQDLGWEHNRWLISLENVGRINQAARPTCSLILLGWPVSKVWVLLSSRLSVSQADPLQVPSMWVEGCLFWCLETGRTKAFSIIIFISKNKDILIYLQTLPSFFSVQNLGGSGRVLFMKLLSMLNNSSQLWLLTLVEHCSRLLVCSLFVN